MLGFHCFQFWSLVMFQCSSFAKWICFPNPLLDFFMVVVGNVFLGVLFLFNLCHGVYGFSNDWNLLFIVCLFVALLPLALDRQNLVGFGSPGFFGFWVWLFLVVMVGLVMLDHHWVVAWSLAWLFLLAFRALRIFVSLVFRCGYFLGWWWAWLCWITIGLFLGVLLVYFWLAFLDLGVLVSLVYGVVLSWVDGGLAGSPMVCCLELCWFSFGWHSFSYRVF